MSWFTEIAGKAEDLLNKVDQTAATALQKQTKQTYDIRKNYDDSPNRKNYNESGYSSAPSYSSSRTLSNSQKNLSATSLTSISSRKSLGSLTTSTTKKKPESDDEKLMQFLNSETLPSPSTKGKLQLETTAKNPPVNTNPVLQDRKVDEKQPKGDTTVGIPETKPGPDVPDSASSRTFVEQNAEYKILQDQTQGSSSNFQSGLGMVNEDISSKKAFSDELVKAENQTKQADAETKRMQKKPSHWNSQIPGNEKAVRELIEREKDMSAALDAKDSQLAILKVRLQEADRELQTNRNIVNDLRVENDRIIKEHAQSAAFQNKTVEVLQEQLQQKEMELNKTKETFIQNQNELMQKLGKMEEEHQHLSESYSNLQKKWAELSEKNKESTAQLKQANGNFDALQQEYNDYKQKAQRILQSKEKLIVSLKGGHLESDTIERNEAASQLLNAEVEGVKQERDLLRDELRRAGELAESYRVEMREMEKMAQNDATAAQENYKMVKANFEVERAQKEELQMQVAQLKEEIQVLREELTRTKSSFQSRIQDREIEIEKLRRQLTAKSLSTVSQDELESRLHALTENLIQKQTLVEALSTEKNSLVLQRERLEQQLREAQNYGLQQHAFVGINNNETERKNKAVLLDNPFDSALTRRVKRVYGSIDSFSIRLGVFFRRYPIARVFVIIYMLLLHFWVMIVLLTYEPEVHNSRYEIAQNQR